MYKNPTAAAAALAAAAVFSDRNAPCRSQRHRHPLPALPDRADEPAGAERLSADPNLPADVRQHRRQALGRGERLASGVAKIGAYQQHQQDLAELNELTAKRDDALHKEKYGDPTAGIDPATGKPVTPGIKNMYGSDAIDYIKSGAPEKAYGNIIGSLAESASSDRVRQMFIHQSRSQRAAFDNVVGEHWNQQVQAQNKQLATANDAIKGRQMRRSTTTTPRCRPR
jgi:hypothetical protein